MNSVQRGGPWTRSKEVVHGPGVQVLSSPILSRVVWNTNFFLFSINISLRLYFVRDVDISSFDHTIAICLSVLIIIIFLWNLPFVMLFVHAVHYQLYEIACFGRSCQPFQPAIQIFSLAVHPFTASRSNFFFSCSSVYR